MVITEEMEKLQMTQMVQSVPRDDSTEKLEKTAAMVAMAMMVETMLMTKQMVQTELLLKMEWKETMGAKRANTAPPVVPRRACHVKPTSGLGSALLWHPRPVTAACQTFTSAPTIQAA